MLRFFQQDMIVCHCVPAACRFECHSLTSSHRVQTLEQQRSNIACKARAFRASVSFLLATGRLSEVVLWMGSCQMTAVRVCYRERQHPACMFIRSGLSSAVKWVCGTKALEKMQNRIFEADGEALEQGHMQLTGNIQATLQWASAFQTKQTRPASMIDVSRHRPTTATRHTRPRPLGVPAFRMFSHCTR